MNTHEYVIEQSQKGKSPSQIYQILKDKYGDEVMTLSTISYTIRKQSWSMRNQPKAKNFESRCDYSKDRKIKRTLQKNPTYSIREISQDTGIASSTVHWLLTTRMNYKNKSLTKVPHELTSEMKMQRVDCSNELLKILARIRKNHYRYFSTGDQSFFFYSTEKKKIWLPSDVETPQSPTAKFDKPKVMITIFWSPHGIQLIKALPKGERFNAQYFQNEVLEELTHLHYAVSARTNKKKFYVHFDNARTHKAASSIQFCIKKKFYVMPHPP